MLSFYTRSVARRCHGTATRRCWMSSGSTATTHCTDTEKNVPKQPLNRFSQRITQPKQQAASQAMLYATGLTDTDMDKAQIGISSIWMEGNPCNMHLMDLANEVKIGVQDAGMVGFRFSTSGVSDGISMGTSGMSYSLQSRDLIADTIETVMNAQWYDGNISLPGCDKNMPGVLIALARVNRPSLIVYGGSIRAGCGRLHPDEPLDIVSAFQSYGAATKGSITEEERVDIIQHACPGAGACGGMYTANTMAVAIEALGMSLPFSSSSPADDMSKQRECRQAGAALRYLMENNILPKDILTRKAFENAMAMVSALGGSTNAVIHLLAVARAANVRLELDDFQMISDRVPVLADLKPSGKYVMEDVHRIGGTPAIMKSMLSDGLLHGDVLTVTGRTLAENLVDVADLDSNQDIIRPLDQPLKATGHLQILRGSLAPSGAVAKISGKEGECFRGPARVFDREEEALEAIAGGSVQKGDAIVIRYEGPTGGPGMPEMLLPTSAVVGAGLANDVALITDGRFSGGSHGFIVGHVTPEAQLGGPIALINDGDMISIDATTNSIDLEVDDEELNLRQSRHSSPPLPASRGTLYKYIKNVSDASIGCVTDE